MYHLLVLLALFGTTLQDNLHPLIKCSKIEFAFGDFQVNAFYNHSVVAQVPEINVFFDVTPKENGPKPLQPTYVPTNPKLQLNSNEQIIFELTLKNLQKYQSLSSEDQGRMKYRTQGKDLTIRVRNTPVEEKVNKQTAILNFLKFGRTVIQMIEKDTYLDGIPENKLSDAITDMTDVQDSGEDFEFLDSPLMTSSEIVHFKKLYWSAATNKWYFTWDILYPIHHKLCESYPKTQEKGTKFYPEVVPSGSSLVSRQFVESHDPLIANEKSNFITGGCEIWMNRECHHYCYPNSSCISLGTTGEYACVYSGCRKGYTNGNRFGRICYPDAGIPQKANHKKQVSFYKRDFVSVSKNCLSMASKSNPVNIYHFAEEVSQQRKPSEIRTKIWSSLGPVPPEGNFLYFSEFALWVVKPIEVSKYVIDTTWFYGNSTHKYQLLFYVH